MSYYGGVVVFLSCCFCCVFVRVLLMSCAFPGAAQADFSSDTALRRLEGLAPVVRKDCRCLILGSFPSPASLVAGQYYGHKQNQFWRLVGGALTVPLMNFPYTERCEMLQTAGLGLWDVYRRCCREGALDAAIRAGEQNDFPALFARLPRLSMLCFNGQTAGKFAERLLSLAREIRGSALECHVLPSSSPAYTLAFEQKLARWQILRR
jgi:hypoxanthine-DNA glycosylase